MSEIGKRYGRLTVIEKLNKKEFTNSVYLCKCDYGNMKEVNINKLHTGHTKSCGCLKHKIRDLTGLKFGRLVVDSFKGREGNKTFGALLGAIGYRISKGISKGLATRKLNKIVPNWNAKNSKINKQLANAGYKNLKVVRDGYQKKFDTIYKKGGYDILYDGISYAYDFITSLF